MPAPSAHIRLETIERYLRGDLKSEEGRSLETHYLACKQCFEVLQACFALQAILTPAQKIGRASSSKKRRSR